MNVQLDEDPMIRRSESPLGTFIDAEQAVQQQLQSTTGETLQKKKKELK